MPVSIELRGAGKSYLGPAGDFSALDPLDLEISGGEYVGLIGRSGSGKSTLLNLISGIERPTEGAVSIAGKDLNNLNENSLAQFRGQNIGIVFQFFQLIPTLSVVENVIIAMDLVGTVPRRLRRSKAIELLDLVGVADHRRKLPTKLSGGEQQRVAIARALANDPSILVADEPTGNLDTNNSALVYEIFRNCAAGDRTVIVATHDQSNINQYSRVLTLEDGRLKQDAGGGLR